MRGCVLLLGLLSSFGFALDEHWNQLQYNRDLCPNNLGVGPSCAVRAPFVSVTPLPRLCKSCCAQLLRFAAGIQLGLPGAQL